MNKATGLIVALVLAVAVGGIVYYQKQGSVSNPNPTSAGSESTNPGGLVGNPDIGNINPAGSGSGSSAPSTGITLAEVSQHSSQSSCWSAINGSVYDLTSWIPNHPGGERAILSICGIDGSSRFDRQHGGDSRALSVLSGFKIGVLAQ